MRRRASDAKIGREAERFGKALRCRVAANQKRTKRCEWIEASLRLQPLERQEFESQVRVALHRKIGKDLPDRADEFESMSAESTGENHVGMLRVPIDDEMMIAAVGVKTRPNRQQRPIARR
jgi:hypothetical protein